MKAKKQTEISDTFTLPPERFQYSNGTVTDASVTCNFTAVLQPAEPQLHQPGAFWEADEINLYIKDYFHKRGHADIDFDSDWVQENLDDIHEAIDEHCTLQAQNDEPNIQGDE